MSSSATSTRSMRVSSALPHPSQQPTRLSIDALYNMAERTRTRSSQESRQQMLVGMQKMVRNDSMTSRPVADLGKAFSQGYFRDFTPSNYNFAPDMEKGSHSSPFGFVRKVEISFTPEHRRHTTETRLSVDRRTDNSANRRNFEDPSAVSYRLNSAESRGTSGYRLNSAGTYMASSERRSSADARSQRLNSPDAKSLRLNSADASTVQGERVPSAGVSSVSGLRLNSAERRASSAYIGHVHTAAIPTTGRSMTGIDVQGCTPRPGSVESAQEARRMNVRRQCCEVMGPGVCRECRKLRVRMMERERMEADFPRLRVSEKNVTLSAMVKRMFPELTPAEIQDKIARGEIARTSLIFPRSRSVGRHDGFSDEEDDEREHDAFRLGHINSDGTDSEDERDENGFNGYTEKKTPNSSSVSSMVLLAKLKLRLRGEASTPLFFMDLRHMNSKIYKGRLSKSLRPPKKQEVLDDELLSVTNGFLPSFVSPRKGKLMEEPAYKVHCDPPLLAKHQQVSNPSFFAGSDAPYSLPDRLPDVIEFADGKTSITDPSMLRSESSMSIASGIDEEGGELAKFADRLEETVPE